MVKIEIEQGILIGGNNATQDDFEYYEFLNIPYAKPPVGDLRFKSPQPPKPWRGERDATTENPHGFSQQLLLFKQKIGGSEDCLYLNVFTTKLPTPEDKPLPVMMYIYGGGFIIGTGTVKQELNGPDFLIKHNVVLVCINYRLGPFGFLCLDIPEAAGNMGLKDQVMAFKWVQKNISKFGGDKDNVTIFGVSAGGASVEYLLLSPSSKGLFHKAIPQSGSALNHWAINFNNKDLSIKLAENLGCESKDEDKIYKFLLKVPAEKLAQVAMETSGFFTSNKMIFGFVPTVEKDFQNDDAFITDYSYNIMKEKRFHDVPILRGFCEFEGLMMAGLKPHVLKEMMVNKKLTQLSNHSVDRSYDEKLAKVYFDEYVKDDNDLSEQPVVNFCGDLDFASGIWISSKLMTDKTTPIYVYMFAYNNNHSLMELTGKMIKDLNIEQQAVSTKKRGAEHGDCIQYLMCGKNEMTYDFKELDVILVKKLTKIWTDFAKTGNPTPATSDLIPIKWPEFTVDDQKYMIIDNEFELGAKYYPNRMTVFEEIYERYRK